MKEIFILKLRVAWSLCLMLVLALSSCEDLQTKDTLVKGVVYDQSSNEPAGAVKINLKREWESATPFGPVYGELIETTESDQAGKFTFQLDLSTQSKYSYYLEVETEDAPFFRDGWNNGDFHAAETRVFVHTGKAQHVKIPLVSYGYLTVGAKNLSSNDSLLFTLTSSINGFDRTCYYKSLDAGEGYSMNLSNWIPSGEVDLQWSIAGSGIDTIIERKVTITKGETIHEQLNFEG